MTLPFGQDCSLPLDFRFNNVPHPTWLRSYLYESAVSALLSALTPPAPSPRLKLTVNYPEVNPAFDTYRCRHSLLKLITKKTILSSVLIIGTLINHRIGTLLEMVRAMALALAEERGLRVRVCVQQALGEVPLVTSLLVS
jgi:hypothetical protein